MSPWDGPSALIPNQNRAVFSPGGLRNLEHFFTTSRKEINRGAAPFFDLLPGQKNHFYSRCERAKTVPRLVVSEFRRLSGSAMMVPFKRAPSWSLTIYIASIYGNRRSDGGQGPPGSHSDANRGVISSNARFRMRDVTRCAAAARSRFFNPTPRTRRSTGRSRVSASGAAFCVGGSS